MSPIPPGLRIAVYNAIGGWGPYTVRQIAELFQTYGFTEADRAIEDVGGARRTEAEAYQQCIDWADSDARRRYLMLLEDVLENYQPDESGVAPSEARAVRRALRMSGAQLPSEGPATSHDDIGQDLWRPFDVPRIFLSHLASRKDEVHDLATMMQALGFACFVAHDAIEPSRAWQREIERGLASCDVLVAYISEGFSKSNWTDQEVGWALGRGTIAIPVAVDGATPYGFLGTFQAVKRTKGMTAAALSRLIFRAIADAVLTRTSATPTRLADRIPSLVVNATCKATTSVTAQFFFEVLLKVPSAAWTSALIEKITEATEEKPVLQHCVVDGRSLAAHVRALTPRP